MTPRVRIGLLLNSFTIPAWAHAMLERTVRSGDATVELVVINGAHGAADGGPAPHAGEPAWRRAWSRGIVRALRIAADAGLLSPFLWAASAVARDGARLNRCLQWLVRDVLDGGPAPDPDAFRPVDATSLLEGAPVLVAQPERTKVSDRLSGADVERIRERRLDVLVRLGFRILRGDILTAATCGVWSYHHGDNTVNRGSAPGFWEVLEQQPTTGVVLQMLSEDLDNGAVLCRSTSATVPFSVKQTRHGIYWRGVSLLPRVLADLRREGSDRFLARIRADAARLRFYSRPMRLDPPRVSLVRPVRRWIGDMRREMDWNKRFRHQWMLLYSLSRGGLETSLWRYREMVPPPDRYWADPFAVRADGRYVVFIEEFLYETGKGHIAALEISDDGTWSRPRPALERPYHLSYPFLFEHEGTRYMIPETRRNRTVEMYRCREFPCRWEPCATLLRDVEAVDATLLCHHGKWWMFVALAESKGAPVSDELFLFVTDDPLRGTWRPHPRNPIVSDVRRARPAGGLFVRDGVLYRPAQDGSVRYGYGIRVHEVETLTETAYSEKEVAFLEPKWADGLYGVHHIGYVDGLSVADALIARRRLPAPAPGVRRPTG